MFRKQIGLRGLATSQPNKASSSIYGSSDQLLNVLMLAVNSTTPVRCKGDLPLVGLCSPPLPVK